MAQVSPTPKTYDVVIAGSGAGGGIASQLLANAGATICMLEAGGLLQVERFSPCGKLPELGDRNSNVRTKTDQRKAMDGTEVPAISRAQGLSCFDRRGGNQRVGDLDAMGHGVLFDERGCSRTNRF